MTDLMPAATKSPTDYRAIAITWLSDFNDALGAGDVQRIVSLLGEDPWWRDLYALTWDLTGMHGRDDIAGVLTASLPAVGMRDVLPCMKMRTSR